MRHSIAVKFIALCLAALSLLALLGSAAGIVGLAASDLYDKPYDEYYNESMHATRQGYAVNLVHRYVSLNLGHLPEQYLNDYHGINWMYNTFRYGSYFYTIRDELGNVVESTMAEAPEGGMRYEMVVTNLRYRVLVHTLVETDQGLVPGASPTTAHELQSTIPPEEESAPTEVTAPPTASAQMTKDMELSYDSYYDPELGRMVEFAFTYQDLPPYTVELYLLSDAMPEEYGWTLLRQIWNVRYQLFWVMGISALAFAVFMVWLCICAGRRKDTDEIRAGGLNCIPLDLYLAGAGFLVCFAVYGGMHLMYYLLREMPKILMPVVLMGGFAVCLLIVAFFFACAAQFKTANGYWWRNSITGRCLGLIVWLWNKFIDICVWLFSRLPDFLRKLFGKLKIWMVALFAFVWRIALKLWELFAKVCRWGWELVKAAFHWIGARVADLYGLLPLMWQWLLTGAAMFAAVFIALLTRSEGLLVLSLCAALVLIFYGATSFGQLLEATRRMGKGDLETQVNDKNLIGSFKEFAGDLNALADVAVVAARNQLKSERMKTELITNVSHDIKTPLTSIINYVDLLQKPHTEEEQEQYLEVLSRQSGQLKKLIEDLMEMSKASTGNMAVDIMAVDAVEAVNQALGEFADKFERISLTPVFRQPEEPVYMKADGRLAWRVLSNLLGNAYKYALPGTRLYIDLMELEGKVLISLKNISREELNVSADELLERFVRGDASRNTEGSGLGLNIAQSLMELQKGQLQLLVDGDLFKVTLVFPAARME